MRDQNIFNRRELRLLYANKPELKPIKVPSLDDVDKVRVPSINEADILNQPTLDQIILQFLHQYEVNVQPRSVGAWNGWDILSAASTLSTAIFSEKEDYNLNIASTIMMANRSNQINSAAQEWGTWKRWALDHKNFEQYKDDVIQTINFHNENATKEMEETIRKAELHNKNALDEIKKSIKKAEFDNENLAKKLKTQEIREYVSQLVETDNLENAKRRKKLIIMVLSSSLIFFIAICFNFINKKIIKNRAKPFFSSAEKELNAGNYKTAKDLYNKALNEFPDFEEAKLGLLRIKIKKAKEFFDLGVRDFNDGNFKKSVGNYKTANDLYNQVLKEYPGFEEAKLGLLRIKNRKTEEFFGLAVRFFDLGVRDYNYGNT